jgi:S-adenosylmethionine hydrolase
VTAQRLRTEAWQAVRIAGHTVPLGSTYGSVAPGATVAVVDSYDLLEIAVHRGRADAALNAGAGTPIEPVFAP